MHNIWNIVKLDVSLIRPYLRIICFSMLLPALFTAVNRSLFTGISFAMCFIAMTAGYPFSIIEKNDMDMLYGILPIRQKELVIGRYLFVIGIGIIALIFSLLVHPVILTFLGETIRPFDLTTAAIAGMILFTLYTVFQLPGYYKFGSIKGRIFMYFPVAGYLILLFLTAKMSVQATVWKFLSKFSTGTLLLIVFLILTGLYASSIMASVRILNRKKY